ncbi:MAG: hypothetical protein E6G36_01095 [Actinobacteria bacterium]|nr:MAG: hypothetical protein E6G36_01095 [Actinomycetota bacterium]
MKRFVAVALAALALPASVSAGTHITVFAAASLTNVFLRLDGGERYSFAGSDQLALQIREGAPADVYAAASPKYTQQLYRDGLVRKPVVFATNKLIILVPRSNPAKIRSVYDLRRRGVKIVIGDTGRDLHAADPRHARHYRGRCEERRQPGARREGDRQQDCSRGGRRRLRLPDGRTACRGGHAHGRIAGLGTAADPV